jgi:hypothetical protein
MRISVGFALLVFETLGCSNASSSVGSPATSTVTSTTASPTVAVPPASTSASVAPPRPTTAREPFCTAVRKLMDDRASKCSPQEKKEGAGPDGKRFEENCLKERALIDADIGPRCLAAIDREGAYDDIVSRLPACRRVFVGQVTVGGACADNDECAGDALCLHDKCVAPQKEGAECVVSFDGRMGCVDGFSCHDEKEEKDTCRKLAKPGEACANAECPFGTICRDTCVARAGAGASCEFYNDCNEDLVCLRKKPDDSKGTCGEPRPAGQRCSEAGECKGLCNQSGKCEARCGVGG